MIDHVCYVPVLTGKLGEFRALGKLPDELCAQVSPVLDVPPVAPRRDAAGEPAEGDAADKIDKLLKSVGRALGNEGRVAVDLLALEGLQAREGHPLEYLVWAAEINAARVQIAVRTDAPASYCDAVRRTRDRSAGICLRAMIAEHDDPGEIARRVAEMMANLELRPESTHLMLDLGRVSGWGTRESRPDRVAAAHVAAIEGIDRLRLLSVAATNVPPADDIRPHDRPRRVQRRDWTSWRQLRASTDRVPVFADYGVTGPRPTAPPVGRPAPHLRYTTATALLIWKGYRRDALPDEDGDYEPTTFADLCREMVDRDDYAGPAFSDGDLAFDEVARAARPGNGATEWVQWATSHHLTHVLNELAALAPVG
jgi:hypothetical protein